MSVQYLITVLLHVNVKNVPDDIFQHFLCKANFGLTVSNKDMFLMCAILIVRVTN